MNKFKAFVIVFILVSFKAFACLNGETKILANGVEVYHDDHKVVPKGHEFYKENFSKLISDLESAYKRTGDIDYLSDKGYVLIIQRKYDEALKLYINIEKIEPHRYSTASNIGTLYELKGENEKAYEWIKKAIKINPESHNGSEWLHLKILEAKIKNLKNISGTFLINTSFGLEKNPKTKLTSNELAILEKALYYQLNERITFIKPKDAIISVLLFELANIVKINKDDLSATEIYELSKKYGFQNELINKRIILCYEDRLHFWGTEIEKLEIKKGSIFDLDGRQLDIIVMILSLISLIFLVLLIVFFLKWKKLKKSITAS
ncbi:hypothetical protein AR687_03700 [Flavobacteriaceae bacterium CRH]|nr:hypothetical protein AR687_03700 [Flavobacteriaceae bacterium CRH]